MVSTALYFLVQRSLHLIYIYSHWKKLKLPSRRPWTFFTYSKWRQGNRYPMLKLHVQVIWEELTVNSLWLSWIKIRSSAVWNIVISPRRKIFWITSSAAKGVNESTGFCVVSSQQYYFLFLMLTASSALSENVLMTWAYNFFKAHGKLTQLLSNFFNRLLAFSTLLLIVFLKWTTSFIQQVSHECFLGNQFFSNYDRNWLSPGRNRDNKLSNLSKVN